MPKKRVLIVDDSVVFRNLTTKILNADENIEVVGIAYNGKSALEKIKFLKPNVVILDIEMPELDGFETLKIISREYPEISVIMCTALSNEAGLLTLETLSMGADDYVTKPSSTGSLTNNATVEKFKYDLINKVKSLSRRTKKSNEVTSLSSSEIFQANKKSIKTPFSLNTKINLVVIGVSTGGPNALAELVSDLPLDFPVPIAVVQHMPPIFTRLLAERLSTKSKLPVKEAQEGDELIPGTICLAPGDYHMEILKNGNKLFVHLNQQEPINYCRPAVDILFQTASECLGQETLAVIMTGMGQDGLKGAEAINQAGGKIIAQDEDSSVVWGMPGSVVRAGLADKVVPLNMLSKEIMKYVSGTLVM